MQEMRGGSLFLLHRKFLCNKKHASREDAQLPERKTLLLISKIRCYNEKSSKSNQKMNQITER